MLTDTNYNPRKFAHFKCQPSLVMTLHLFVHEAAAKMDSKMLLFEFYSRRVVAALRRSRGLGKDCLVI